ncbi:MAG: dihydroorotase [Desulfuromonadaceae bacterium]|nr:dihydroorotase [Desulfuromonas sp.]MDY0185800.1 dihydroorotase [Desulfuromonadaceae bacterium]
MKTIIKNGRVIDPAQNIDAILDVVISAGCIESIAAQVQPAADDQVIDATGLLITPGLVDIHVHLRDPGYEYKEDIVSGTRAAAAGGFTSVACMPNTNPSNDNKAITRYMIQKAELEGYANVFPICSITKGQQGDSLVEMGDLKLAGCVGFSDDGLNVEDGAMLRHAMEYAQGFDMPIIAHSEDESIKDGGVMNEGPLSTELGLTGNPWVSEAASVARDIMLAELTGARLHICHISSKRTVELVREAKQRGVRVTCEVTPHHFTLTEEAVRGYEVNAKVGPPLRTAADVAAMKEGLRDGTIDAIATDHAPHHIDDKNMEFVYAAFGMIGLETALPLSLRLVDEGVLSLNEVIACLSCKPANVLRIPRGTLIAGAVADIALINLEHTWEVTRQSIRSRSFNTPFEQQSMKGKAVMTLRAGRVVHKEI